MKNDTQQPINMKIHIPDRINAPETSLFVKFLKKDSPEIFNQRPRDLLLLIPGGPGGNHTLYADIEDALLEHSDLAIIDLRGCGYSDPCDSQFCTLDHHIDDLEAIRIVLHIDRMIMHGCSYGAMVALGYAIHYPHNIEKLMLSSGAASGDFINSAQRNLSTKGTALQIETAKTLWEGQFTSPEEFSAYYKIMAPLYVFNDSAAQTLPALKYNIPYNTDLVNLAFTTFLKDFDFTDRLAEVRAETLIFTGENDWITDVEQAKILHRGIPESTLEILPQCGHFPWRDQRDKFLARVKSFIL